MLRKVIFLSARICVLPDCVFLFVTCLKIPWALGVELHWWHREEFKELNLINEKHIWNLDVYHQLFFFFFFPLTCLLVSWVQCEICRSVQPYNLAYPLV